MKNLLKALFPIPKLASFDWDSDLAERRARMDVKRKKCIEELGEKWLLHPNNKKSKLNVKRPV